MIEVRNLVKEYPGVLAVNDISFNVERGEIVGFLGPNGAGKSTTMRILTCFLAPTKGSAEIAGFDILNDSLEVRKRVGYLPESNPLYTEMRVQEYLMFRAGLKRVPRADRKKAVEEVLDRVSLTDRRKSIIGTLSKGLRQRVGLADAIVHKPELIIMDEPTQGLDPNQVRDVRRLVNDLGEKHTLMLSTHILGEVEKTCGRVIIVNDGQIVAEGAPLEIVGRLTKTGKVRIEAAGDGQAMKSEIEKHPGVERVIWNAKDGMHTFVVEPRDKEDLRRDLMKMAVDGGWELFELGSERVSLEDAFAEITTKKPEAPAPEPEPEPAATEEAGE